MRAEKIRTDRGAEYRIPLTALDAPESTALAELRPAAVAPITGRVVETPGSKSRDVDGDEQIPSAARLYEDLKAALAEAAALRVERNIVESQLAETKKQLAEVKARVEEVESKAYKLETERIELLSELEQLRIALRHREERKMWRR